MKSIHESSPSDTVRRVLRQGDPAGDGREPGTDEVRLLRARVLEEARKARSRSARGLLRPAVALAGAALVCIAVLVAVRTASLRRPAPPPQPVETTASIGPDEARPRQVQFTTPGGTRIVWVLYPEEP